MPLQYDERKNGINLCKHGIPLEDGLVAINDPDAIVSFDMLHSTIKDRFTAIGRCGSVILFVSFTIRDEVERIISVRKAEPEEEAQYWTGVV